MLQLALQSTIHVHAIRTTIISIFHRIGKMSLIVGDASHISAALLSREKAVAFLLYTHDKPVMQRHDMRPRHLYLSL